MKKLIVNKENPNGIIVDLTAEEIEQQKQDAIKAEQDKLLKQQQEQETETKKASAKQKLIDLGLTEEEVKALIGI